MRVDARPRDGCKRLRCCRVWLLFVGGLGRTGPTYLFYAVGRLPRVDAQVASLGIRRPVLCGDCSGGAGSLGAPCDRFLVVVRCGCRLV